MLGVLNLGFVLRMTYKTQEMQNFLSQVKALDNSTPQPETTLLEPRSVRRQKARDAAKSPKLANPPDAKEAC